MLYTVISFVGGIISIIFYIICLLCTIVSKGIPWVCVLFILVCFGLKILRLRKPSTNHVKAVLGLAIDDLICFDTGNHAYGIGPDKSLYWPIANRGAAFDAPENSMAAIKKCIEMNCNSIFLDVSQTKCGELVILNKATLEKAGITTAISSLAYCELESFNISEHHPLSEYYPPEKVLKMSNLLTLLSNTKLTIFFLLWSTNINFVNELKVVISKNEQIKKRSIFCSTSPLVVYQLRKMDADLVCALWINKVRNVNQQFNSLSISTLVSSLYGAICRNVIVPLTGISVVIIHKEEFNAYVSSLWKIAGVLPIVYSVNSPNEKRYYQNVIKVRYLTESLRSEPIFFLKNI